MIASALIAMFGGICCTPSALRTSCSTTEIFTKLVATTAMNGTIAASARIRIRLSGSIKAGPATPAAAPTASFTPSPPTAP